MAHEKQKILIVDDNPDNIRLAAGCLKEVDVSLAFATDGYKALIALKAEAIDLVLMDVNMPGMDGFETVRKIKEIPELAPIPIIFLTANNDPKSVVEAFGNGGADYITKPFSAKELQARVKTHLELFEYSRNLERLVEEKTSALEKSMMIDQATGAYNVSKLYLDLSKPAQRVGTMMHIRNLQQLEIAFGLEAVERLLSHVVRWIEENRKLVAHTYRVSFADFICLFEHGDMEEVEECCKELLQKLPHAGFEIIPGNPVQLGAVISAASASGKEMVQHLRIAQMEAEAHYLPFFRFREEGMQILKKQENNLHWMKRLHESFDRDTLTPFFQPIIDLKSGKIVRYECLARIKEGAEVVSPFHFIEAAKQLGAITEITRRMLRKSFEAFAGSTMGFSINITDEDLNEGYLGGMLSELAQRHRISPEQVVLEVLEDISVFGNDQVLSELHALKSMGFKIALDDFGSENASFSRMLNLQVDMIKIDGMFIKNIHQHENSYKIVKGIARLAGYMGYAVVAEFVHCQEVVDAIGPLGIQYAQGYHFGAPAPQPLTLD